jgi:hypothetical protein
VRRKLFFTFQTPPPFSSSFSLLFSFLPFLLLFAHLRSLFVDRSLFWQAHLLGATHPQARSARPGQLGLFTQKIYLKQKSTSKRFP